MWEGNRHSGGPSTTSDIERFKKFVRDVPDFPQKGVLFRDITPLLGDRTAFNDAIDEIADAR